MKNKIFLLLFFACGILYILVIHGSGYKAIENDIRFQTKLSAYGLFRGEMAGLTPATGVEILKISSSLFTDYAEKQRLIKLPKEKAIRATGDALPEFPEGTILAKTFYYSIAENNQRRLIETRLLILKNGLWNAATYQWHTDQQEATLIDTGTNVPITFKSTDGESRSITYQIPAQRNCASCHRTGNQLIPIGPKISNLNINVTHNNTMQNQLSYLQTKGLLQYDKAINFNSLPNYRDASIPIDKRARAYFAINCAHCHQPSGIAGSRTLNLDYQTDYEHTGIKFNKLNILSRMATMGEYHMPKIGTTIIDKEGLAIIKQYISSLPTN